MQIIKINGKQTKITTADGKRYKAKEIGDFSCTGCEFRHKSMSCDLGGSGNGKCVASMRPDGKSIVWVVRKEKPTEAKA